MTANGKFKLYLLCISITVVYVVFNTPPIIFKSVLLFNTLKLKLELIEYILLRPYASVFSNVFMSFVNLMVIILIDKIFEMRWRQSSLRLNHEFSVHRWKMSAQRDHLPYLQNVIPWWSLYLTNKVFSGPNRWYFHEQRRQLITEHNRWLFTRPVNRQKIIIINNKKINC